MSAIHEGHERAPGVERPERPAARPATPPPSRGGQMLDPAGAAMIPPPIVLSPPPRREDVERDAAVNDARFQALAAGGIDLTSLMLPGVALVRVRLGQLLEQLLGDMDSPARLEHERRCNAKYAEMLDDMEAQVARARLLNGVHLSTNGNGRPA